MEFKDITVADLRANCGTLVTQIESEAQKRALEDHAKAASAPASYPQLKDAFGAGGVGAEAAFIVDCQEKNLSLAEAHKAYAAKLRSDNAALTTKLTESQAALAEAQKKNKPTEGENPLPSGQKGEGAQTGGGGGKHPFLAKCEELVASKAHSSLSAAMIAQARIDPAGHRDFIKSMQKKPAGK